MVSLQKTREWTAQKGRSRRDPQRKERLDRLARMTWVGSIAFVALLIAVVVGFQYAERDQIRSGVTAFGVDLGGMSRDEARAALVEATSERASQPITLVDGTQTWQITEHDLGLRFDIDGALDEAFSTGRGGFGPERLALFWHLPNESTEVGNDFIAVDTSATNAHLATLASEINQPTIEPQLEIHDDGAFTYVNDQTGRTLDVEASEQAILDALASGERSVDLTIQEFPPAATDSDYREALTRVERILGGNIVLQAGDETWDFAPAELVSRLSIIPPEGDAGARIEVDVPWVGAVVEEISRAVDRAPQSPRIWWGESGLVVTKDPQPGSELDKEAAHGMIADAFTGVADADHVELPVRTIDPPPVPEDLNALGLNTVFAESSTPYGEALPEKKHNIELAASLLNGVLVMPGQMFSFNAEIGPMTVEAGFKEAYGILEQDDGALRTIPTEAGGICQVATTVFQPVFAAGYAINQLSNHSYWIQSYSYNGMVALDATVDPAAGLDLKWTNDSENPVMIQAEADGENFTVRLTGQPPDWEVEIKEPVVDNIQWADPDTVYYEPDTSLEPGQTLRVEMAQNGFDAQVVRVVRMPDGTEYVMDITRKYGKSRNVVLVGSEDGELPEGWSPVGTSG